MAFSISFTEDPVEYPYDDEKTGARAGLLVFGDDLEVFLASLFVWTVSDYETQWKEAIQSLLDGATKAALIVEYVSPESKLEWWPMFRVGETVFVQNHLANFFEPFDRPFDPSRTGDFLKDRRTENEDGNRISEWQITMDDLRAFINPTLL